MSELNYDTELLGWLPAKDRLKVSLKHAFAAAANIKNSEVQIEHLLAAFLEDIDANVYFATRKVDREELRKFCISQIGDAAMPNANLSAQPAAARTNVNPAVSQPSTTTFSASSQSAPNHSATSYNSTVHEAPSAGAASTAQPSNKSYTGVSSTPPQSSNSYSYARDSWSHPSMSSAYHRPKSYGDGTSSVQSAPSATTSHSMASVRPSTSTTAVVTAKPKPASALRRMMAQASDLAECEGRNLIDSETVIRAIAVDPDTNSGRFLRGYLKDKEIGLASIGRKASQSRSSEQEKAAAKAAAEQSALNAKRNKSASEQQPEFNVIIKRCEAIMQLLQRELQKDIRYRLANDLTDFLNTREKGALVANDGAHLGHAAHPILRTAELELRSDPNFQAHEQLRNTLRALNMIQGPLQDRLLRLQDVHGEKNPIIQAIKELIDLEAIIDTHSEAGETHTTPYAEAKANPKPHYEMGGQTVIQQVVAATNHTPQQEYYDASFVTIDNKKSPESDKSSTRETSNPQEEHAVEDKEEKKRHLLHHLFAWRKQNAPMSLFWMRKRSTQHNDDTFQKTEDVVGHNDGSEINVRKRGIRHWFKAKPKPTPDQEMSYAMTANKTSRPTLLHASAIAFTLITGAVAIALTANSILS